MLEEKKKSGVSITGGTAIFMMLFILIGSFGGLMYLIEEVFS